MQEKPKSPPRTPYKKDLQVKEHDTPGRYPCGDGFYLDTSPTLKKSFVLRVSVNGKITERGLGSYPQVSLAEARALAKEWTVELRRGNAVGARAGKQKLIPVVDATTFRQAADEVYKLRTKSWKLGSQHRIQWEQSLAKYVFPLIGDKPVSEVTQDDIEAIFEPIWIEKHSTAAKLLPRVGMILDWAIAKKLRTDNPAKLRGPIRHLLPQLGKDKEDRRHNAIPFADVPEFMAELQAVYTVTARALEFTILTAVRTNETLKATWDEIDLEDAVWTIPAARMKSGAEHRVPLSSSALALLRTMQQLRGFNPWVFPSTASHLSNMAMLQVMRKMRPGMTVHGFRSSFRDWVAKHPEYPEDAGEAALAHVTGSKTKRAYKRTDYFDLRCVMMQHWADYLSGAAPQVDEKAALLAQIEALQSKLASL